MKEILDLLSSFDYWDGSKNIHIAKGKYKYPTTFSELWNVIRRNWYGR